MQVEDVEFEENEVYAIDIVLSTGEGKPKILDEKATTVYKRALDQEYNLKAGGLVCGDPGVSAGQVGGVHWSAGLLAPAGWAGGARWGSLLALAGQVGRVREKTGEEHAEKRRCMMEHRQCARGLKLVNIAHGWCLSCRVVHEARGTLTSRTLVASARVRCMRVGTRPGNTARGVSRKARWSSGRRQMKRVHAAYGNGAHEGGLWTADIPCVPARAHTCPPPCSTSLGLAVLNAGG
eukprot:351161-Chlamydomonas_euryale.AAC.6